VLARPATLRYRAAKLLRRHRVAIPAVTLAAILIVGFAATTWWEARRAQRQFQQVRSLAHSVLFELHDAVAKLPGSTAARELLVRRALEYLQNLSREAGNNADLQREVAIGFERVAVVQGSLSESNLGHVGTALENFRKAQEILGRLQARDPKDLSLLHDYRRVSTELAASFGDSGAFQEGTEVARRNVVSAGAELRAHPADPLMMEDLMAADSALADLLTDGKQYADAIPIRERVEALAAKLVELKPGDEENQRSLAVAEKRLGALYGVTQRYQQCRQEYERAKEIDERRVQRWPTDMRAKLDLSYAYSDLGWVAGHMGNLDEQLAAYRRTLELREEAAKADPNDQRAATGVASITGRIGTVLRDKGQYMESLAEIQRAVTLYEKLAGRPGADWASVRNLAEVHVDIAETLAAVGKRPGTSSAQLRDLRARGAAEYETARRLYEGLQARGVLPAAEVGHIAELRAEEDKLRRALQ
jgi:tetratricopeptide (TPR) repeat protein